MMFVLAVSQFPRLVTSSQPLQSDHQSVLSGVLNGATQQQYPWVILSDLSGSQLFILAQDIKDYQKYCDKNVMQIVSELGFTRENNKPIAIAQPEQCIYTEADD